MPKNSIYGPGYEQEQARLKAGQKAAAAAFKKGSGAAGATAAFDAWKALNPGENVGAYIPPSGWGAGDPSTRTIARTGVAGWDQFGSPVTKDMIATPAEQAAWKFNWDHPPPDPMSQNRGPFGNQAGGIQPGATYGSYTIDPTKGLVPIAGSQGTVMPGSDPMAQARAAGMSAQQPAPAPVVNSWTINPPGTRQYDPAAMFNQAPTGGLPPLNTGGVNPYLTDPLMAGFRGQQNPLYLNQQQQNDFYGDPELFGGGY